MVYPEWHFTLLHRGLARPLPLLTEWSAPIPALWSLVTGQPRTPRTFTGSGSAPTAQMEHSQHVCGQYSSTQTGLVGGVWAAFKDCLAFGTYFPAGVALTEPPRSRSRPAVLLAVHCVSETNSTQRRETCEDRHDRPPGCVISLLRGWSLPDRAHPYDRTLRLALTEPARVCVRQV